MDEIIEKKQILMDYFKKKLDNNDLKDYTLDWIDRNYQKLNTTVTECHLWNKYTKIFQEKYNLGEWHNIMTYDVVYNIYMDVGFSDKYANLCASHVRRLMLEYENDNQTIGWSHQPNIFYWTD